MKKLFILALVFFAISLGFASAVSAARVYVMAPRSAARGEEVLVNVRIDTQKSSINALSGTVTLSPRGFSLKNIYDGDSTILFWLERPSTIKENSLSFSGITPNGFSGDKNLFSFTVVASTTGEFSIDIGDFLALSNDGTGAEIKTTTSGAKIAVSSTQSTSSVSFDDPYLPETFVPLVSNDAGLYGGAPFISFATQDKGSGIERYELARAFFYLGKNSWQKAESPMLLQKSDLFKKIYIKAIDRSGNERIVSIAGPYYYATIWNYAILILLIVCALIYIKR